MGKVPFAAVSRKALFRRRNGLFASSDMTALLSRFGYSVYEDDSAIRS